MILNLGKGGVLQRYKSLKKRKRNVQSKKSEKAR
jgi:hypothetical protein